MKDIFVRNPKKKNRNRIGCRINAPYKKIWKYHFHPFDPIFWHGPTDKINLLKRHIICISQASFTPNFIKEGPRVLLVSLFKEIVDGRVDKDITTEHPHRISMPMNIPHCPPFILKTVKDKENLLTYTTENTYLDEYNGKKKTTSNRMGNKNPHAKYNFILFLCPHLSWQR